MKVTLTIGREQITLEAESLREQLGDLAGTVSSVEGYDAEESYNIYGDENSFIRVTIAPQKETGDDV